jgi:membrane fusion protein, multidrug efflux system
MPRFIYAFLVFFIVSCSKQPSKEVKKPVLVEAVRVVPRTIPLHLSYIATVHSSHIVELRARVEGYLEKILYDEGSLVKKGDLMFVLDQRPFEDEVKKVKGQLARKEAFLWNTEQTKKRMIPLYQQNAVSQKDYDQALAEELEAKADVTSTLAQLAKAKLNLSYASIEAPVTGLASRAKYREGALIAPCGENLLTTIYVIDPIWVNFAVSEGDILKIQKEVQEGRARFPKDMDFIIDVQLADGQLYPASGHIDFTDPALQQTTGTMMVRAVLPNPNSLLRPGQFVRAIVKGITRPNAIAIPQKAVLQGQKGTFVYVINRNNQAEIRPVITGDWVGNDWVILSGLKRGDVVITEGINKVQNKTDVTVTRWKQRKGDV